MTKKLCGCNDPMRDEKGVFPTHPAKSYKQQIAEKDARIAELEAMLKCASTRLTQVDAIIATFPRLADEIMPKHGMEVYRRTNDNGRVETGMCEISVSTLVGRVSVQNFYSTPEAAIAAQEGE